MDLNAIIGCRKKDTKNTQKHTSYKHGQQNSAREEIGEQESNDRMARKAARLQPQRKMAPVPGLPRLPRAPAA